MERSNKRRGIGTCWERLTKRGAFFAGTVLGVFLSTLVASAVIIPYTNAYLTTYTEALEGEYAARLVVFAQMQAEEQDAACIGRLMGELHEGLPE